MTHPLSIQLGSLMLLSGAPGSGKSMTCQSLPSSWVVSSDRLRQTFFGMTPVVVDGQVASRPMALDDGLVFSVMERVVRSRLEAGLTTVVDATLITDQQRRPFAAIAEDLAVPVHVVILDPPLDQLQQQNRARVCPVPSAVVSEFHQRLQRDSHWPWILVTAGCDLQPLVPTIPASVEIDAIGDVHGLADELQQLLATLGYDDDWFHPEGRKLCFLGDLVDRGRQSLAVLDRAMAATARGHYCVLGNHDRNLLRGLQGHRVRSRATQETLHYACQRDASYRATIIQFLQSLPTFYQYRHMVLCHADIDWFDPLEQPGREHVYGKCKRGSTYNTDARFCHASDRVLIRGHIPLTATSPEEVCDRVYSLEKGAGFGGPMVALRLPQMDHVEQPCAYDYSQKPPSFADRMKPLLTAKLVKQVDSSCGRLRLYKYTPKAFFSTDAWQTHPELKLARGIVVGLHGEPVSAPFPRTFNYKEQHTTLPLDTDVVAVEKLNGFLVTTFLHPYQANEVVVSCSGSFAGDYVDLAKGLLYHHGLYGRVLDHVRRHPHTTLLWEAIHPQDPHIIPYDDAQHGLYLIGAGMVSGPGQEAAAIFQSEAGLDTLATALQVPRPSWFTGTFAAAIAAVQTVDHEGFMIRLPEGPFALKLKSPYYLRIKFLARMTEKKSTFMFRNGDRFKRELDEELWPLVEAVVTQTTEAQWLAWSDTERRDWIQAWMASELYV